MIDLLQRIKEKAIMLTLTRKAGEAVIIENQIKIKLLEINGKEVCFGIEAPENVAVNREEIHKKILAAQALLAQNLEKMPIE